MRFAYFGTPHIGGTYAVFRCLRVGLAEFGITLRWVGVGADCGAGVDEARWRGEREQGEIVNLTEDDGGRGGRALVEHLSREGYDGVFVNVLSDRISTNAVRYLCESIVRIMIVHSITPGTYAAARAVRDFVHATIAVSPRIYEDLVFSRRFDPNRTHVIPTGIDLRAFGDLRRSHGATALRLLSLGRIEDGAKGVLYIPRILKELDDVNWRLTIAGDGPDGARLAERLSRWPSRVRMLGPVAPEQVPPLFAAHDVYLLPSRFEGQGISLIEAMAAGCVPVASRITGVTDAIVEDGETGCLFSIGNTGAAAEAIRGLANDSARRVEMSRKAQGVARSRFGLGETAAAYATVIEGVMRRRPAVRRPLDIGRWKYSRGLKPCLRTYLPVRFKNALRGWREKVRASGCYLLLLRSTLRQRGDSGVQRGFAVPVKAHQPFGVHVGPRPSVMHFAGRPQVHVAILGARQHYAVPRSLAKSGMLGLFYTDVYAGIMPRTARLVRRLSRWLRLDDLQRFLGRMDEDVPTEKVVSFMTFGAWYVLKQRLAGDAQALERVHVRGAQSFNRRIIWRGVAGADLVYGCNGASLELFEHARENGIGCVLEQTIAPQRLGNVLIREEWERWPGWEPGLCFGSGGVLAQREQGEWEFANLIVTGSNFVLDGLRRCGVAEHKCRVVPYGVPLDRFVPLSSRSVSPTLRLLFAGEVGLRKGAPYLLEALRLIDSPLIETRLAGRVVLDAQRLQPYSRLATLLGPVPRAEMARLFQWADVLVLPSICEGSALVAYEALVCGVPVVATPNAGVPVRDGVDGLLVPLRDVDALAAALERFLTDKEFLRSCRRGALDDRDRLGLKAYRERLVTAIRGVADITTQEGMHAGLPRPDHLGANSRTLMGRGNSFGRDEDRYISP